LTNKLGLHDLGSGAHRFKALEGASEAIEEADIAGMSLALSLGDHNAMPSYGVPQGHSPEWEACRCKRIWAKLPGATRTRIARDVRAGSAFSPLVRHTHARYQQRRLIFPTA
jgi:hypothetical protein